MSRKPDPVDSGVVRAYAAQLEQEDWAQRLLSARSFLEDLLDDPGKDAFPPERRKTSPDADGARALADLLLFHTEKVTGSTLAVRDGIGELELERPGAPDVQAEAATILLAGATALSPEQFQDPAVQQALLSLAVGAGPLNDVVRTALLQGQPLLKPIGPEVGPLPKEVHPLPQQACMAGVAAALGRWRTLARQAEAVTFTADADGITQLEPNEGRPGDFITLHGDGFGDTQPLGTYVVFPQHGRWGTCVRAEVQAWTDSSITVRVPPTVGSGPVGFLHKDPPDAPEVSAAELVHAANGMSSALLQCLGPGAIAAVDGVRQWRPHPDLDPVCPELLANNANEFTGGPAITSLAPNEAQPGAVVEVSGRLFLPTDVIRVGDVACYTTYHDSDHLSFIVQTVGPATVSVEGGDQPVFVRTAEGYSSDYVILRVLPLLETIDVAIARPGQWLTLAGAGFSRGCIVHIGSHACETAFVNRHTAEFQAYWPEDVPTERVPVNVEVRLVLWNGLESNGLPLKLRVFGTRVLGDSVAWGQGLPHGQKFASLVQAHMSQPGGGGAALVSADIKAHSGATIVHGDGQTATNGEIPVDNPTIQEQLASWADDDASAPERARVDLVLVNGGINDINVRNILSPRTSEGTLRRWCESYCFDAMRNLLVGGGGVAPESSLDKTFPSARIVVLGYYPLVSEDSDVQLIADLGGLLYTAMDSWIELASPGFELSDFLKAVMARNSSIFLEASNSALARAVDEANANLPYPRFLFVSPSFRAENAMFASRPYLFGLVKSEGSYRPQDPLDRDRATACDDAYPGLLPSVARDTCKIASMGHPNVAGAQEYAYAIQAALRSW